MRFDNKVSLNETLPIQGAIQDFLIHHQASGHSPFTIIHYRTSLKHFEKYLIGDQLDDLGAVRSGHLRAFFAGLVSKFKPRTAHGIASDIRAFFSFLFNEELISANPVASVSMPKLDKTVLDAFEPGEVKKLLALCQDRSPVSIRNRAMLVVLLDSGVRVSELALMRVGDVDFEAGSFKVLGKGRKERICRLSPVSLRTLTGYCKLRRGQGGEPLWCGKHGPLTRNGVGQIIANLGNQAGVHAHPHKFRRTCALTMLRNGCDIFSLQYLLGHSDLTVSRRYLAQSQSDYQIAHERFSAVSSLLAGRRAS